MKHKPKLRKNRIHWSALFSIVSFLQMLSGVGFAVFALKWFMIPSGFIDGGVTGVSLLLHELFHIKIVWLLVLINLVFVIISWKVVSKEVAIRSAIAITLLALALSFIHVEKPITDVPILAAIFGGILIGIGMGLAIRSGAMIDGAEIIAVLTTRRVGLTMSEVIVAMNTIIFLIAAFELKLEIAMYAIITYFIAVKTSDYIADGLEEYTQLTIICEKSEEVKSIIVNDFAKGITIYKGERGYLPGSFEARFDCDIIVTIVTRLELLSLKNAITLADPGAFMYVNSIKETSGGVLKHKHHHG